MENTNKITRTELVFILDRSGSMNGLEQDTIGGFNSMLAKQQKLENVILRVTTVLFDDRYELLHDRLEGSSVPPMTENDYTVRGCTALLDAMGRTITKIADAQRSSDPEYRADKVIFVIITDGLENASRRYSAERIRKMVTEEQEKYGWEFIFLGANIDAIQTAGRYGIREDRAANYNADAVGTGIMYECVGSMMAEMNVRAASAPRMDSSWKQAIDADYNARGKKHRR